MPKTSEKDRVGAWIGRVTAESKNNYEQWEAEYSTDKLEEYYYGKQWVEQTTEWEKRKYVINLFFPSINISKPSLLFSVPKYRVDPRLSRLDDPLSDIQAQAKLQENALQTEVDRPALGFATETGLAILDAQFRTGIVQIGRTADYIDNPNADKPILVDDTDANGNAIQRPMTDGAGNEVKEPRFKLKSESLYIEWIPSKQWRVGGSSNRLESNDWCGYYKWVDIDDIKRNPNYKNTSNLKATGQLKSNSKDLAQNKDADKHPGKIKVWFIWDMRAQMRFVFDQNSETGFFLEKKYKFLPFADLKFNERLGHYYPLPESSNWVHPQNELNHTREMQRIHRQRATRRYTRRPSVPPEEFAKLMDGEDMTCIETARPDDVMPIPDAPLDPQFTQGIAITHDDFTRVTGISGEAQQVAQSETATQANLIAVMGQTRESAKRLVVAMWLSRIGRIILLTLRDAGLPFWVKSAVDPNSPSAGAEAQEVAGLWKQFVKEDLGEIDNDITVEIDSMSPIAREQERNNWLQFLQVLTNPAVGAVVSASPILLRKTAGLFDIHSEKDLQEVSAAMQKVAMMFAQQMAAKQGIQAPMQPQPGPTPNNGAIAQQLTQQLPVEQNQIQ